GRRPPPRARALPAGALHRPDGTALRRGARGPQLGPAKCRLVERERSVGHARDAELRLRPPPALLAVVAGLVEDSRHRGRQYLWFVGRDEQSRLAVDHDLRNRADARYHDGLRRQHRLEQSQAEALPARGMDEHVRALQPGGNIWDPTEQVHRDLEIRRKLLEVRALRALPQDDELGRRMTRADIR